MSAHIDAPSTTPAPLPSTGINVEGIFLRSCEFRDHAFDAFMQGGESPPDAVLEVDLQVQVGVALAADRKRAFVHLELTLSPKVQPTYTARAGYAAQYSVEEGAVMDLEQFAWQNGVAYLVPYIRQQFGSMTQSSVYPAYMLPPLGVAALLSAAGVKLGPAGVPVARPSAAATE